MKRCIITYDISDNRRRKRISDILEGYGKRVQYSVFEVELKNESRLRQLKLELFVELLPNKDSIRIYPLCENCLNKAFVFGDEPDAFEKDAIYFF